VITQVLIESITLYLVAAVLGTALAWWMVHVVSLTGSIGELPRIGEIHLDATALAFALVVAALTGIAFGLFPSLTASRPDLAAVLKSRGELAPSAHKSHRANPRNVLVVGQVALSIVLLSGTALLVRSLVHLNQVDMGFDSKDLLTFRISLSPAHYSKMESQVAFYDEVLRRIDSLPGVQSSTVSLTAYDWLCTNASAASRRTTSQTQRAPTRHHPVHHARLFPYATCPPAAWARVQLA